MKGTFCLVVLLLIVLPTADSNGSTGSVWDDTTIRVLFVKDHTSQTAQSDQMISFLKSTWSNSHFDEARSISLQVVNLDSAVLKPGPRFSGSPDDMLEQLKNYVESPHPNFPDMSIRDYWGADLVVGLAQTVSGFRGWAPMDYWIRRNIFHTAPRSFVPNCATGCLDLRGSEEFYLAVVQQDAGRWIATHELGHLFGAGHWALDNYWLRTDSHAYGQYIQGNSKLVTAVGEFEGGFCNQSCIHMSYFSGPNFLDPQRRNTNSFDITAASIANYRVGPGPGSGAPSTAAQCGDGFDNDGDSLVDLADPGCTSTTDNDESDSPPPPEQPPGCDPASYVPTNVTASLYHVCYPGTSKSSYRVQWSHACPGGTYQIHAFTSGLGYYYVSSTYSQSVLLTVEGPPSQSDVFVRACNSSFCSQDSWPPVKITDLC